MEFTNRAVRDLHDISKHSHQHYGQQVADALEARIREVIAGVAQAPESAPRVEGRTGMRVVPLVRYPFKIFYRIVGEILHIRHAARRPWDFGEE